MAITRQPILEADLLNGVIILGGFDQKVVLSEELKQRYLERSIDPFWHSENDHLDYLVIYNTGEYFCQRRKLKYDFKEKVNYWGTYAFHEASEEQVNALREQIINLFAVSGEITTNKIYDSIEKIDREKLFFDQRYAKKVIEKNKMLSASDWRILPDIIDSFPGEKEMWMKWRQILRSEVIKKPEEFGDSLEFFKYLYDIKYPIDPKKYKELYPNDEVEYLSTEDQWVKTDVEASNDFVDSRIFNILSMSAQYKESYRRVKSEVMSLMKLLEVNQISNINLDDYVIE